jgi:hypothetical protein
LLIARNRTTRGGPNRVPGYPIFWDNRPGYARPSDALTG